MSCILYLLHGLELNWAKSSSEIILSIHISSGIWLTVWLTIFMVNFQRSKFCFSLSLHYSLWAQCWKTHGISIIILVRNMWNSHSFTRIVFFQLGLLPYTAVSMLDMFALEKIARALHIVFSIIDPPYIIFGGLYYIDKVRFFCSVP